MANLDGRIQKGAFSARLLRLYLFYRFCLALILLLTFTSKLVPYVFGSFAPKLYLSSAIVYVVIAAITLGFYQLQRHSLRNTQLLITLIFDIAIQTLLMYSSGGLASGIGYLLLVTVAAGSIFFTGQLAVLIPAIGSICIILESILATMVFGREDDTILPAGVLGVLLFLTSLLFSRLSKALVVAQEVAETESELSAELEQLNQLIINRMRTGIVVVNGQGRIQQINRAAQELLGAAQSGKRFGLADSIRSEARLLKRLLRWRKNPNKKTKPFIPQHGNTELQANFAHLDQGGDGRTIIFLEDFRAAAQQAQQLKLASLGRLTGSIAHEIRNPLGAISHASELLGERCNNDPTTIRLTEIIATQVKRVNHIVENVLQLSRRQRHQPQKLDIQHWLREFVATYALGSREQPDIELKFSNPISEQCYFDPTHLQQILTNLLDNALRHSKAGTGAAWAALELTVAASDNSVHLDVVDAGSGVPAEHRGKLFEPFFTTSPGGSGLGLFIARELCAINYATLKYQGPSAGGHGYFRITFMHPDKIPNPSEEKE